jgi:malate dehydrogenase (oxaloacetate-decarboxylating)
LKLAAKNIEDVRINFFGAGAANTSIARLIIAAGGDSKKIILFDAKGGLHSDRSDLRDNKLFYKSWELCQKTNPGKVKSVEEAMVGADVLIALSKPGPDTIKPELISAMAEKSIVFACANPVPEIYPYAAKKAGAYIVGTGRGDFPNQVNNSLGFPGILKGALIVRAKKITDNMAIAAAKSLAGFAEKRGIDPDNIIPKMDEIGVFPMEAADVAMQAIKDGVARNKMSWGQAYAKAKTDIEYARKLTHKMMNDKYIKAVPFKLLDEALEKAINSVK